MPVAAPSPTSIQACCAPEGRKSPTMLRVREESAEVARDVPGLDQQGDHPDADQKADQVDPEDMDRGARLRAIAEGAVEAGYSPAQTEEEIGESADGADRGAIDTSEQ